MIAAVNGVGIGRRGGLGASGRRQTFAEFMRLFYQAQGYSWAGNYNEQLYFLPAIGALLQSATGGTLTGWTGGNGATLATDGAELSLTGNGSTAYATASLPTFKATPGDLIEVSWDGRASSSGGFYGIQGVVGLTLLTNAVSIFVTSLTKQTYRAHFVVTAETCGVRWANGANPTPANASGYISNVSVRRVAVETLRQVSEAEFFAQYTAAGTTSRGYLDKGGVYRDMSYGRTNLIRNSVFAGATVGSSSGITNMALGGGAAINSTVIAKGAIDGVPYIDVRYVGTVTTAGNLAFRLEAVGAVPASVGQTWTSSMSMALIAGSFNGVTRVRFYHDEVNASLATTNYRSAPDILSQIGPSLKRLSGTTTVGAADTSSILPHLRIDVDANVPIDFTMRFVGPQINPGPSADLHIKTEGTAITGANLPRFDWTNGKSQLLLENQSSNLIRDNTATTLSQFGDVNNVAYRPLGWATQATLTNGTVTTIGKGVDKGIEYVDVSFQTASPGSSSFAISFDDIAAAIGETWTASVYLKWVSKADISGLKNMFATITERANGADAAGQTTVNSSELRDAITSEWQRFSVTKTLNGTDTISARPRLFFSWANGGGPINCVLRIGLPQAEKSPFASAPIKTYGSAVIRPIESFLYHPVIIAMIQMSQGFVVARADLTNTTAVNRRLIGLDGTHSLIYAPANKSQVGAFGGVVVTTPLGSGDNDGPISVAMAWDPTGRAIVGNGGPVATDTNVPGNRATVYLGRSSSGGANEYADGRYDFSGGGVFRPANDVLQKLAVAA